MNTRRGPVLIEDLPAEGASPPSPADAPPVPDMAALADSNPAMAQMATLLARPVSLVARLFWAALAGLTGVILSVTAWDFVASLLGRNVILARIVMALLAIIAVVLASVILRELAAFARLRKIDAVQVQASAARASGERAAALALAHRIAALYASRPEIRWGRADFDQHLGEILDADALLDLTEKSLLVPLDDLARRRIEAASRQVAAVTALVPLALADVAAALVTNVRMVRQIAEIYGGRAGFFGSWRLLRAVATHLVATGAIAAGDDMLGSIAGGGMLAKISRRFGEGVINGALTARVGIAAMEVCRPMPFHAVKKPGVSAITGSALKGLFIGGK